MSRRQRRSSQSLEPRVVLSTERLVVIDDVLSDTSRDRLWNYFQVQEFRRVENAGLYGHWSLDDAAALRGPSVGYGFKLERQYPSKTPVDLVMRAVLKHAACFEPLIGKHGEAWEFFTCFGQVYQRGVGLVWHRDASENAGSYTYYAHPQWNVEWGGELMLLDDDTIPEEYGVYFHRLRPEPDGASPAWQAHLDNADANELLMQSGVGRLILPKPNRLVVISGGTPHCVGKVRPAAGNHVRASVSGFFKRGIRES